MTSSCSSTSTYSLGHTISSLLVFFNPKRHIVYPLNMTCVTFWSYNWYSSQAGGSITPEPRFIKQLYVNNYTSQECSGSNLKKNKIFHLCFGLLTLRIISFISPVIWSMLWCFCFALFLYKKQPLKSGYTWPYSGDFFWNNNYAIKRAFRDHCDSSTIFLWHARKNRKEGSVEEVVAANWLSRSYLELLRALCHILSQQTWQWT